MELVIDGRGQALCIYNETIDLAALGKLSIRRVSHVEPDDQGQWWADLGPSCGPVLGPFAMRSAALSAERHLLEKTLCVEDLQPRLKNLLVLK